MSKPHYCAEEKHIVGVDAAVHHPLDAVGPGSRQIVTAKMLHDILLQNKCYNLQKLLKKVTNTICYRTEGYC